MHQTRRHPSEQPNRGAPDPAAGASRRGHLIVVYSLVTVLIAISLWCFVVLGRTEALRGELTRHMDWLKEAGDLRDVLDAGTATPARAQRLVDATRRLVVGHGSPELDLAAQRLEQRLADLAAQLALSASPAAANPTSDSRALDDLAESSYAVLTVLPGLETQVQSHVVQLYAGLDRLWTSLRTLVLLCLLLCASNFGLLYLVYRRRMQLEAAHAHAVALASHDPLTGVWNRVEILRILRHELSRAERTGRSLGVLLLDLDDFRKLNVLLGSREADHVLREISRRLAAFVRPYDTLGRLGGDSFLVILPSCDAAATAGVADRLRQSIEDEDVEHAHGRVGVRATLVHETLTHDPDDAEANDTVDPDLLVHGLQLRVDERRQR